MVIRNLTIRVQILLSLYASVLSLTQFSSDLNLVHTNARFSPDLSRTTHVHVHWTTWVLLHVSRLITLLNMIDDAATSSDEVSGKAAYYSSINVLTYIHVWNKSLLNKVYLGLLRPEVLVRRFQEKAFSGSTTVNYFHEL